jgi:hypothetical protein
MEICQKNSNLLIKEYKQLHIPLVIVLITLKILSLKLLEVLFY